MTTLDLRRPLAIVKDTHQDPLAPSARRRGWDALVRLLLAVAAIWTRGNHVGSQAFSDDEGTYVAQAWAVVHEHTLSHYTYWYDHPPLGWLVLAGWQALTTPFGAAGPAVMNGRVLMVVLAALDVVLLHVVARRLGLGRLAAAAACGLWLLSPLALDYSRMVFLDGIALPMLLGGFALAMSPRRHLWAFLACGLLLASAVLTKETLILSVPAVLLAAWRTSAGRTRPFCLVALGGALTLVLAFYPLLAALKGELLPGPDHVSLWSALRFQLVDRPSGGSPLVSGTASSAQLHSWLALDPVLLLAGVAAAVLALRYAHLRAVAVAVLVPVAVSLRPGYLPDPFVVALLPFCALALAGAAEAVLVASSLHSARRALPAVAAATALALAVVLPAWGSWSSRTAALDSGHADVVQEQTQEWIAAHVPRRSRLLVDDTLFVDLARAGFDPHFGVVWFYKTDFSNNLDPSVARTLPNGYRDLGYVVSSPVLRAALRQYPQGLQDARYALRYSRVLATFGKGPTRVEIRRVQVPPGAPRVPRPRGL